MSNPSMFKINASEHTIESVTIFKSSKAEIVRHFSLNLKAGQNRVEIRGLPSTIDTHSVRVSGLGDARLYDVVCTIGVNKDASYAPDSSSEIIRLLRVRKHALESEKRVREHEADLLVNYAKTLTGEHVQPTQMSSFLETFVEQGRKNLENITTVNEKIIDIDRQIEKETSKSIIKKGNTTGELDIVLGADDATAIDLKVTYIVSNVFWKPTYELHATTENGKPSSSVALHYRARVTQSTGEDWTNTALTLSTMSSDTIAKRIPQLLPVKIQARNGFGPDRPGAFNVHNKGLGLFGKIQPVQQQQQQQQPPPSNIFGVVRPASSFGTFGSAPQQPALFGQSQQAPAAGPMFSQVQQATGGSGLFGASTFGAASSQAPTTSLFTTPEIQAHYVPPSLPEEAFEEISAPESITEPTTFVNETPVSISFSITGESTIPSDGIEHQVSVAVLPFDAKISYVAIPRIEPRVYLQCQVKNSSEYRLLAGPVTVILDDSYVSKTSITDVNTGENFDCTLGDDAATKVTYSRTARTVKAEGGSFTESKNTTTYTTKITIYNKHVFAIPNLVVRDVIPTCDDKRAKVILRKPDGLADAKDGEEIVVNKGEGLRVAWEKLVDGKGGEKEGKFEWRANVKAKDKVLLESQWELKAPSDTIWTENMVRSNEHAVRSRIPDDEEDL